MPAQRILLVEDLEDDVFFFKRTFKRAEVYAEIEVATDGAKAIDFLTRHAETPPDVIFLDLKLPNQNGFEVLAWLKQNPALANTKVYILTSSGEPREQQQAKEMGADDYFVKPLLPEQLREALARH
ncbi:MAG TPA: response regulator [Bryobacteraceae bacterium]|nr:response regulator [Bryobacteraceae bacterium]